MSGWPFMGARQSGRFYINGGGGGGFDLVEGLKNVLTGALFRNGAGVINATVGAAGGEVAGYTVGAVRKGFHLNEPYEQNQAYAYSGYPGGGYSMYRGGPGSMVANGRPFRGLRPGSSYVSGNMAGEEQEEQMTYEAFVQKSKFESRRDAKAKMAEAEAMTGAEQADERRALESAASKLLVPKTEAELLQGYITELNAKGRLRESNFHTLSNMIDEKPNDLEMLKNIRNSLPGGRSSSQEGGVQLGAYIDVNEGSQGRGSSREFDGGSKYDSPKYGAAYTAEHPRKSSWLGRAFQDAGTFFHGGLTKAQREVKNGADNRHYEPPMYEEPVAYNPHPQDKKTGRPAPHMEVDDIPVDPTTGYREAASQARQYAAHLNERGGQVVAHSDGDFKKEVPNVNLRPMGRV